MFFYQFFHRNKKVKLIFCITFFSLLNVYTQNISLENYEWNHRIILMISNDESTTLYEKQLKEFERDNRGFSERKLLIFDVKKDQFRKISYKDSSIKIDKWEVSNEMYQRFSDKETKLKIVLIGLDGGIKRVFKDKLLKKETLFTIIDGMFLRKQEMKQEY